MSAGCFAWLRISRRMSRRGYTSAALVVSAVVGVCVLVFGQMGTFVFCGLFVVFAFFETSVRPYAVAVLLAQQRATRAGLRRSST